MRLFLILFFMMLIVSCGRSKESQYYVLNPIPCKHSQQKPVFHHLRIGIDRIKIPGYLEKPQLSFYCTSNQVHLEENHQWAEALKDNIMRVLQTNLSTLLPGAIIEVEPWNRRFVPEYTLQVMISEYKLDIGGKSELRAEYLIYHHEQTVKKQSICYCTKLSKVSPQTLVSSMNHQLTQLSHEISQFFIQSADKEKVSPR
ncbi:PqiC family protein [Legionella londiniensis]|nr:PqiC family protein [Legionella londiniensis]